jgi:hypothetical protein
MVQQADPPTARFQVGVDRRGTDGPVGSSAPHDRLENGGSHRIGEVLWPQPMGESECRRTVEKQATEQRHFGGGRDRFISVG